MISAILARAASLATGHASGAALPEAIASARPSQPGKPHPPQFAPGSSSRTAICFSSTSTSNTTPAIPRKIPINTPTAATTAAAMITA